MSQRDFDELRYWDGNVGVDGVLLDEVVQVRRLLGLRGGGLGCVVLIQLEERLHIRI